jgi:hypothetical protein
VQQNQHKLSGRDRNLVTFRVPALICSVNGARTALTRIFVDERWFASVDGWRFEDEAPGA